MQKLANPFVVLDGALFVFLLLLPVPMSHTRDEPIETKVRRIDWRIPGEQQHVVQESAKCAAKERRNHRNLQALVRSAIDQREFAPTQK